ncbi:MAG TPA: dihydrodipicolinate synthase family protein [Gammaproteobacteria bacterium]|nr:dihydrodipicolinate synthase family protein [Gammaproteobacteria bacterium]
MSGSTVDDVGGTIERRAFLRYASGAVIAGAAGFPASGFVAEPAYVPGASTTEYDKMFVASVTPYKPGTEDIDETAFRAYMRYWAQPKFIDAGGAMLVSPEAGEAFYLTQREKIRLAEIALEEIGDRSKVFSGVMQTTTKACVEEAQALKSAGVHGLFLMPPIGTIDVVAAWDPEKNPEVWIDQLKTIADAVNLPVIIHPTGGKYFAMPLTPGMKIVDAVPQIVGYKMITADVQAMAKALRGYSKRHVGILLAGAGAMHDAILGGYFDGTVSGSWNYAMEPMVDAIVAARDEKNVEKAQGIWSDGLLDLHRSVTDSTNGYRLHSAYKACTWLRGLIPDPFLRAPQRRLPINEVVELRDMIKKAHLDVIADGDIRRAYPELT